jgi:hypothetical protein
VNSLIASGHIKADKVNGRYIIDVKTVNEWLASLTNGKRRDEAEQNQQCNLKEKQMAQKSVDDQFQAINQGFPAGSRLDAQPVNGGSSSPWNRKPSPDRQKEKSLGVHPNLFADSKYKR